MFDTFLQSQLAIFQYAKINYCNHIVRCLEMCCLQFFRDYNNRTVFVRIFKFVNVKSSFH